MKTLKKSRLFGQCPCKIGLEWQLHPAFLKLLLLPYKLSYGKCKITPVTGLTCHPKAECWVLFLLLLTNNVGLFWVTLTCLSFMDL